MSFSLRLINTPIYLQINFWKIVYRSLDKAVKIATHIVIASIAFHGKRSA